MVSLKSKFSYRRWPQNLSELLANTSLPLPWHANMISFKNLKLTFIKMSYTVFKRLHLTISKNVVVLSSVNFSKDFEIIHKKQTRVHQGDCGPKLKIIAALKCGTPKVVRNSADLFLNFTFCLLLIKWTINLSSPTSRVNHIGLVSGLSWLSCFLTKTDNKFFLFY